MNPAHRKIFEKKYGQHEDHQDTSTTTAHLYDNTNTVPQVYNTGTFPTSNANTFSDNVQQMEALSSLLSQYNSSKFAIRSSSDYFPNSKRLQKSTSLPISINILPYPQVYSAEEFPVVDYGNDPIVRCEECRTYVSPFTEFVEGGDRFRCNLCGLMNITPTFYHCKTDSSGQRTDRFQRSELYCGTYDIKAGKDYMARQPVPPIYFFVIDVSEPAVKNGSLETLANILNEFLTHDYFPGDVRSKIGFLVFDKDVHLVNLNHKIKHPQIVTLTDIDNLSRLPIFDNLLVNIRESKDIILKFVDALPKMFSQGKETQTNLFSSVRVAASILRRTGGRMYVFQSSTYITHEQNPSNSSNKNQNAQANKTTLFPSGSRYMELTPDMQQNFVSCNLFVFSNQFRNIINIAELPRYLNGDIYYYPEGPEANYKFYYDFRNSLSREYTWESVFRIRISSGWKISNKWGNYSIKASGDLLSVPNVDGNKSMIYELELESEVSKSNCFYLQSVLLYTTSQGERRLRIINYGVPLTGEITDIHNNIDAQVIAATLLRQSLNSMYSKPAIGQIKEELITKSRQIFTEITSKNKYKIDSLPETLVTFSMAILGILKHSLFREKTWHPSIETDVASALRVKMNMMNIDELMLHFVPYLFALHTLQEEDASYYDENGSFIFPQLLNLSMTSLTSNGIYLMDGGEALYMLVGGQVDPNLLGTLFGVNSLDQVDIITEDLMYQNQENPLVVKVNNLINELRNRKGDGYVYLYIIKEGQRIPAEVQFYGNLIEDKMNIPNSYNVSYADFLNVLSMPVVGNGV